MRELVVLAGGESAARAMSLGDEPHVVPAAPEGEGPRTLARPVVVANRYRVVPCTHHSDSCRPPHASRRRFLRTTGAAAGALALGVATTGTAAADASNNPAMPGRLYAADRLFATRGLTALPPPRGNNAHSFDRLFVVTNGVPDQVPVAEAAPGEQDFNGGRWVTYAATWTLPAPDLLTSDDAVWAHYPAGHLTVTKGSPPAGLPGYFECPLIPLEEA